MNSILNAISGASGSTGTSILLQAIGAAMRGEDAQTFMKRLANQHPQLKKVNLSDLAGSAQQLAKQNNVDVDGLTQQLDGIIDPMIKK